MRFGSDRFRQRIGYINRWTTRVEYSNDGGRTWIPATFLSGTCTQSALQQTRWACELELADVEVSITGINAFSTQLRIFHGMQGEPELAMGVYKVTNSAWGSESRDTVKVRGLSHEVYLQAARFYTARSFKQQPASALIDYLIHEILPGQPIAFEVDDETIPGTTAARDRWPLIDGDRNSSSIAKALGARVFAGPAGNWIVRAVPTLYDAPVWEASGDDVLLAVSEELSDDGVYNVVVVNGQSTDDKPVFGSGIAEDLDPNSPTYVRRKVTAGGFGPRPRFYSSEFITSQKQAQKVAEGMLAPYLGLRQSISFTQAHNPTLEPGDVGIVHTPKGDRRVLLDELVYDLTGAPMTGTTRTTATTLVGNSYEPPDEPEGTE